MTESLQESPELIVKNARGISAVWLVPMIALLFGGWLVFKAIADRGVFITVQFENANGIVIGKTEVRYKGLTVGTVSDVVVSDDLQSVLVEIEMIGASKNTLTDKTLFWYVTADVSFQGVSGLDTLLSGSYINIQPDVAGDGVTQREFVAIKEAPELSQAVPGLHITLSANKLGSVAKNSPVSFKQINVGYVSGHQYDAEKEEVKIHVFIEPEYASLVKESTRFWNVSGVQITGSVTSGIKVNTESLASIISGGIAFDNLSFEAESTEAENGQNFQLFDDFLDAQMGHEVTLVLGWNANVDIGASVVYQGLTIGRVDSFEKIDPVTRQIRAKVKMNPRIAPYLTTEAQFFIAAPEFDLGGATNLNQLIAGSQIKFRPSLKGDLKDEFMVYSVEPAYKYSEPGLHLVLKSDHVESLKVGSSIYFEQQVVGSIQAIENKGPNQFLVHIFIQPSYQDYVTTDSRFWNASGVRISGSIQNIEVQTQSLQTILKGGIAFDVGHRDDAERPKNGDIYTLLQNKNIAKERIAIDLVTTTTKGIKRGMRIMYGGEKIGSVHAISRYQEQVFIHVGILPEFEFILREGSQFWLAKAQITLSGLDDTDALFGGDYFNVSVGDGEPASRFNALLEPPQKPITADGLQISLIAESGNVASSGSPVSYRGVVVGQVDNISLNEQDDNVLIHLTIAQEYRHLINGFTRFYSASGVTITGSLSKVVMKTESVDTILKGGISFYNGEGDDQQIPVKEGDNFTLYKNVAMAESAGKPVTIYFNELEGLKANMAIKYKGQSIGLVERLNFEHGEFGVTALVFLNDAGRKFAVEGSKYWLAQPQLGLVGSQNLDAIIESYISALPGTGAEKTQFYAEDIAPAVTYLPYGLNVTLVAQQLGSVRVGDPVLYRQVKVGKVIGVDLSAGADKVNIYLNIVPKYKNLVTAQSQFWNTSGVHVEAGLFSGVTIDSESVETILAGGVAFATPESADGYVPVANGHSFTLQQEFIDEWHEWAPTINIE
ncbi:PqiB family protein [Thalassotalea atypica]|uniref:PqiB family protein n=1 Tax=Thalassotalea atypica TaxID=2054316 RepID=UPI0025726662|nr:MlaD family protein [Thalassotalea atypica]